jgi:single-strand DNA-binding protein
VASPVRSLNRVILIGNVGKTPETTVIAASQRDVAKFSLATKEGYYDANKNWKDSTEWHNIVAFGPVAKKVERSVAKGDLVLVEGRIRTRKWTGRDNQERYTTEINVDTLVVLNKMNRDGQHPASGGGNFPYKPAGGAFAGEGEGGSDFDAPPPPAEDSSYGEEDPF